MRVWVNFLAAEDAATLKERPHQGWGFGQRPAVVLIDLYRWVFGDSRPASVLDAMPDWPGTCGPQAWEEITPQQLVLGAARAAGIPIVHATGLHPLDSGVAAWSTRGKKETASSDPVIADRVRRR